MLVETKLPKKMAPPVQIGGRGPVTIPLLVNTAVFLISSYNIIRVYKGVHPVISPKLAAAGIYDEDAYTDWIDVNGKSLPSFARLMRPFRKEKE